MTAPGSGEQITADLAEALTDNVLVPVERGPVLAALLPVVEAYATRKAAEELRAAMKHDRMPVNGRNVLRARADALTATPNHGTDATT